MSAGWKRKLVLHEYTWTEQKVIYAMLKKEFKTHSTSSVVNVSEMIITKLWGWRREGKKKLLRNYQMLIELTSSALPTALGTTLKLPMIKNKVAQNISFIFNSHFDWTLFKRNWIGTESRLETQVFLFDFICEIGINIVRFISYFEHVFILPIFHYFLSYQ